MIAAIVDLAEAITNVYPILQMFDLAFGHFPSAATLASMVDTELSAAAARGRSCWLADFRQHLQRRSIDQSKLTANGRDR